MKVYFNMYEEFLRENLPQLHAHFTMCGLTPDLYLIDWYTATLSAVYVTERDLFVSLFT